VLSFSAHRISLPHTSRIKYLKKFFFGGIIPLKKAIKERGYQSRLKKIEEERINTEYELYRKLKNEIV